MKKVYQLLGKAAPIAGEIGIEIECEGKNLREVFEDGWRTERDGSLRGEYPHESAEFILDKPIVAAKTKDYINKLSQNLEGAKFDFSFRTSVHVHVNVQDCTEVEVMNLAYTYLLLEEPLINFCGRDRKGNRFCLRVVDAEAIVAYIRNMCKEGLKYIMAINENEIRYSALNLASLRKYGSVEFRSMRGNMDADTLHIWVNSLMAIKKYAMSKKKPSDVREEFEKLGPAGFIKKVLGEFSVYYDYPRATREMKRSFSLSLEIPYAYVEQVEVKLPEGKEAIVQYYREKFKMKMIKDIRLTPGNDAIIQINIGDGWVDWALSTQEDLQILKPIAEGVRPKRARQQDF